MELKYRSFVFKLYRWLIGVTVLSEFIIIRINLHEILNESWWMGAIKLLLASTVPLSILYRLLIVIRPAINSKFSIEDKQLKIKAGSILKEINYSEIQEVRFSLLPPRFFGGYKLVLKSGQVIHLLSAMENNQELLKKICLMNSQLCSEEKLNKYLHKADDVEASWKRLQWKLQYWPHLVFKYLVYPLGMSSLFYEENYWGHLALFIFVVLLVSLILNSIEDHIYSMQKTNKGDLKIEIFTQVVFYAITLALEVGFFSS